MSTQFTALAGTQATSQSPSLDSITARSSTKVYLSVAGRRVARVQSLQQSITNNIQVLNELGSQFAVELKKGITSYSFTIARFFTRLDAFEDLKLGQVFALEIFDNSAVSDFSGDPLTSGSGAATILELFQACSITTISRDFTVGQAVVAENATVVTIGQGYAVNT
jgi:hypothetical protein